MLADVLESLPKSSHPNLLVDMSTADDAGVYRLDDETALVQTVDFFPPIVDDPYDFGRIAAANALSDIYAMGGRPLTALNIVGFPMSMPTWVLTEVLRGGADVVTAAGAVVVGGHSVKDTELKFGVAATGIVNPNRVVANTGAQIGDRLFLTKPLGTGIMSTALKRELIDAAAMQPVVEQMATLNRAAAEIMTAHGATAATDVTGFGFLGHLREMVLGSGVAIDVDTSSIPVLDGALTLADRGVVTGGSKETHRVVEPQLRGHDVIATAMLEVLIDPQTSGGLLIAVPTESAQACGRALAAAGLTSAEIARVVAGEPEIRLR